MKAKRETNRISAWAGPLSPARTIATVLAPWLVGCGSSFPEPRNELVTAEASYRAAQAAGAEVGPQSALYLRRAREQIEVARALMQDGNNERALWVLRRAQSDATLAHALARETVERRKAIEAKEALDQLRSRIDTNGQ